MPDQPISGRSVAPAHAGGYTTMNTVRALERLAAAPHSAPELGDALGVSAPSARRMLRRLHAEGYVVQDVGRHKRYRATLRLVSVAALLLRRATLPRLASPVLETLAADGTAGLWIVGEDRPVCIAQVDPPPDAVSRHPTPGVLVAFQPQCAGPEPVVAVLDPSRRERRSCAFRRQDGSAAAAAAVLDRGVVVGALGLSGDLEPTATGRLALAAAELGSALAAAARG